MHTHRHAHSGHTLTWTCTLTHTFPLCWDHTFLLLLLTLHSSEVVLTAVLDSSQKPGTSHTSLQLLHRVIGWTHSRSICPTYEVGAQTHRPQRSIKDPVLSYVQCHLAVIYHSKTSESIRKDSFPKKVVGVPVLPCSVVCA